jgi:hypothetical protein
MLILKTNGDHLLSCVRERKHALHAKPELSKDEIILLCETADTLKPGQRPIRYAMRFSGIREDTAGESRTLWGRQWRYIIDAAAAWELHEPFSMQDIQVTERSYAQGGPVVHVHPDDERVIRSRGLLQSRVEAEQQPVRATPEQEEAHRLFVALWDSAVAAPGYDKRRWGEFLVLLRDKGVVR